MSHHSRTRKSRRAAIVAGGIAAVLLPLGLAGSAMAATFSADHAKPAATAEARASQAEDEPTIVTTVTEFYEGYIAARGEGNTLRADELRQTYLDADFQQRLAQWEQEKGLDGVTRSQNVPVDVDVAYDGSGAGSTYAVVTLHWDGGAPATQLLIKANLETQKITDIRLAE